MTIFKKQQKLTKLWNRRNARQSISEDFEELQSEVQELEKKLKEKQTELFQWQRNSYRHKASPSLPKQKSNLLVRPQILMVKNSIDSLKKNLELMSMISGMEVQSYVAGDHCCVIYHMQHDSEHTIKHGLKIDLKSDSKKMMQSMPVGFNLQAVLDEYDVIMKPDCLGAVRSALVAYYERNKQFNDLKSLQFLHVQMFKTMDASHIELTFFVQSDEEEKLKILLTLDYRVYDIIPKTIAIRDTDLDEDTIQAVNQQCAIFKHKPLVTAFEEAFIDGIGQYKMVNQVMGLEHMQQQVRPRHKRTRQRAHKYNPNLDDTFHPEECSDFSGEDIE